MEILIIVVLVVFALSWGSFLGLVGYRMPLNKSIIKPRSVCDNCGIRIKIIYLIPVLGFVLTAGKCKNCGVKIPVLYPILELITAALLLYSYQFIFTDIYSFIRTFILISFMLPSILTDLSHRIIPDRVSIGLIVVGFLLSLFDPFFSWTDSLLGILFGGGLLFLLATGYYKATGREGLGGGDIKILAGIGALLGWQQTMYIIFFSSILGSFFGIAIMLFLKKDRLTALPFGPFIAIAAIIYHFLFESGVLEGVF